MLGLVTYAGNNVMLGLTMILLVNQQKRYKRTNLNPEYIESETSATLIIFFLRTSSGVQKALHLEATITAYENHHYFAYFC